MVSERRCKAGERCVNATEGQPATLKYEGKGRPPEYCNNRCKSRLKQKTDARA